jgi:hypothetical protein
MVGTENFLTVLLCVTYCCFLFLCVISERWRVMQAEDQNIFLATSIPHRIAPVRFKNIFSGLICLNLPYF